jgi:DNA polymerase
MGTMGADQNIDFRRLTVSALDWWRDAGVDTLIDEAPRQWLLPEAAAVEPVAPLSEAKQGVIAVAAPMPVALPDTIDGFVAWRTGPAAPEASWGSPLLGAQGNPASDLMVMVDMPDRDDIAAGRLLSGPPGALFDRMLAAIGRDRNSIYLTALAVSRPVSNRIPAEAEAELSRIALHLLGLTGAKRLLMMGNATSRALLGPETEGVRGNLQELNHRGGTIGAVGSFHPRFLIERPAAKADAWRDLQLLMKGIDA